MSRSRVWILAAIAVIVVIWIIGRPNNSDTPLSPWSTQPLGTAAMAELFEGYGSTQRLDAFDDDVFDAAVIVLLLDRLSDDESDAVDDWVEQGGRLVVADPSSRWAAPLAGTRLDPLVATGCAMAQLNGLEIDASSFGISDPQNFDDACFTVDSAAFLARRSVGAGEVISLGSTSLLVNENLGNADNAAMIGRIVFDGRSDSVAILRTNRSETADPSRLSELVPISVRWFSLNLVVAALLAAWAAGRRFGAIVREPPVIELPGSLAVRASADLHRRVGGRETAAVKLRQGSLDRLRRALRMPPGSAADAVIERAQHQLALPPEVVSALAGVPDLDSDADLEQYVNTLDAVELYLPSAAGRLQ